MSHLSPFAGSLILTSKELNKSYYASWNTPGEVLAYIHIPLTNPINRKITHQRQWTNVNPHGPIAGYKLSKKEESGKCSFEAVHCKWFPRIVGLPRTSVFRGSAGLHLALPFSLALVFPTSCCLWGAINRRVFTARFISFSYRRTLVWLCAAQVRDRLEEKSGWKTSYTSCMYNLSDF